MRLFFVVYDKVSTMITDYNYSDLTKNEKGVIERTVNLDLFSKHNVYVSKHTMVQCGMHVQSAVIANYSFVASVSLTTESHLCTTTRTIVVFIRHPQMSQFTKYNSNKKKKDLMPKEISENKKLIIELNKFSCSV